MDRGGWQATVHMVTESDTTEATKHSHTYMCTHIHTCNIQLYAIGLSTFIIIIIGW